MDAPIDPDLKKDLQKAHLRYVSADTPGITRKRYGEGFRYLSPEHKVIIDRQTLNRINDLVIPPAWKEVWIAPTDSDYLQATGLDDKGRKQYLYHGDWLKISQENKFNKMIFFGSVLPEIRAKINKDMLIDELVREKILAAVVWLLEHTFIRIGNQEYVKQNNSYGLTTLRNKHVDIKGKNLTFEFKGKSGVEHTIKVTDPQITQIIKQCVELPGYEIFKYIDDNGDKHNIDSADVNEYLKSLTGEDITAKDFRTWGGTVLSAETLYKFGASKEEKVIQQNIIQAIKKVSARLGNTTTVCRNYYVHPTVLTSYEKQLLIPHFDQVFNEVNKSKLSKQEYAVISLLNHYA